jgi:hypothetical protein
MWYLLDRDLRAVAPLTQACERRIRHRSIMCSPGCSAFRAEIRGQQIPIELTRSVRGAWYPSVGGLIVSVKLLDLLRPFMPDVFVSPVMVNSHGTSRILESHVSVYTTPDNSAWSRSSDPAARYYNCPRCRCRYLQFGDDARMSVPTAQRKECLQFQSSGPFLMSAGLAGARDWEQEFKCKLEPYMQASPEAKHWT